MNDEFNTFWLFVLLIAALLFGAYLENEDCKYEEAIQEMGVNTYYTLMIEIADSTGVAPSRKEIAKHYLQINNK